MAAVENDWVSVAVAAKMAGCSEQYIRRELLKNVAEGDVRTSGGRLEGWRPNGKAWLVSRKSVVELGLTLTTRASKNEAKRKTGRKARKS